MKKPIRFRIKLPDVIPKPRPRSGWNGQFYYPNLREKELLYQERMRAKIRKLGMTKLFPLPKGYCVSVDLLFVFKIPKSTPKRDIESLDGTWYNKRSDIDNLTKMYLDTANGVLFHDDSQVVDLYASKIYKSVEQSYTIMNLVTVN